MHPRELVRAAVRPARVVRASRPNNGALRHRLICGAVFGMLGLAFSSPPLQAQVLFDGPKDTTAHLGRYQTIEECQAALVRVSAPSYVQSTLNDTLPDTYGRRMEITRTPVAEEVRVAASTCGPPFNAKTAPLTDFLTHLNILLLASRDSDAATFVARRLEAIAHRDTSERVAVLDTIIHVYLGQLQLTLPEGRIELLPIGVPAQPGRLAAAEPLVIELGRWTSASWVIRSDCYIALATAAWAAGDTVRAVRASQAVFALAGTLSPSELRSDDFVNRLGPYLDLIQSELSHAALLDSLRHSTTAYTAAYRDFWDKLTHGRIPAGVLQPIGKPAPLIEGDFWFGRRDTAASRPAKGKISLVVLFNTKYCCGAGTWSRLRRLTRRFPALEVTFVTQTAGYFGEAAPPSPQEEGAMLAHALFEERRMSGVLAVTNTAFWRLPDPDRRRINQQLVPNMEHYAFGRSWLPMMAPYSQFSMAAFLVDPDGIVVGAFGGIQEAELTDLIAALFERQSAKHS